MLKEARNIIILVENVFKDKNVTNSREEEINLFKKWGAADKKQKWLSLSLP